VNFPEYEKDLPTAQTPGGDYPTEGLYRFDNSAAETLLGVKFRALEESIVDLVRSLQAVGALDKQ
jgi:aspartate/tyrosine/aromatic aminotransferase